MPDTTIPEASIQQANIQATTDLTEKTVILGKTYVQVKKDVEASIRENIEHLKTLTSKTQDFISSLKDVDSTTVNKLAGSFIDAAVSVDLYTINIWKSVEVTNLFKKEMSETGTTIMDTNNAFIAALNPSKWVQFGETIRKFELAKAFEDQFVKAASSSGILFDMFGKVGIEADRWGHDMTGVLNLFTQESLSSAHAIGMTLTEAMTKNKTLMTSIGGTDITHRTKIEGTDRAVSDLTLISTVAKGTGQNFDDLAKTGKDVYEKWGFGWEEAAKRTAVMIDVQQKLHVGFDSIQKAVGGVDSAFSMWGDNMEGALSVLEKIQGVLKEQGLGIGQSTELIKKFADHVSSLTLSQRAFIGMQSGMTGGAVNVGLQVERMQQEGKFDQILQMVQDTVSKTTGNSRILNLKEAAENPELSTQYLTQRSVLQQVTGISDTGTQNRLLDVMSKVQLGGERGIDANQILRDSFSRGADIQERQYNKLTEMKNLLDEVPTIASILKAYSGESLVRGVIGRDNRAMIPGELDTSPEIQREGNKVRLANFDGVIKNAMAQYGDATGMWENIKDMAKEGQIDLSRTMINVKNNVEGVLPGIGPKMMDFVNEYITKSHIDTLQEVANSKSKAKLPINSNERRTEIPIYAESNQWVQQQNQQSTTRTEKVNVEINIYDELKNLVGQATHSIMDWVTAGNMNNSMGAIYGVTNQDVRGPGK